MSPLYGEFATTQAKSGNLAIVPTDNGGAATLQANYQCGTYATMSFFKKAIAAELARRDQSPIQAALASGLNRDALRFLNRGSTPIVDRAEEICRALGLEFYIGPPRADVDSSVSLQVPHVPAEITELLHLPKDASAQDVLVAMHHIIRPSNGVDERALREAMAAEVESKTASLRAEMEKLSANIEALTDASALANVYDGEAPPDARPVDVLELASAAGGGAEVLSEEVSGRVWFRRSWLDGHALNASRCVVIGVAGESMEPTLMNGSKILVDRQRTRRREGDIFVVASSDGLLVKRAGRDKDGNWLMVSDHPVWKDVAWPEDARVIGRVVWTAKTLVGW